MSVPEPVSLTRVADLEPLRKVRELVTGDRWSVDIPVLVSAQESGDVAKGIFNGAFLAEKLAAAMGNAQLNIVPDESNPNQEIIRLSGIVSAP